MQSENLPLEFHLELRLMDWKVHLLHKPVLVYDKQVGLISKATHD